MMTDLSYQILIFQPTDSCNFSCQTRKKYNTITPLYHSVQSNHTTDLLITVVP